MSIGSLTERDLFPVLPGFTVRKQFSDLKLLLFEVKFKESFLCGHSARLQALLVVLRP